LAENGHVLFSAYLNFIECKLLWNFFGKRLKIKWRLDSVRQTTADCTQKFKLYFLHIIKHLVTLR